MAKHAEIVKFEGAVGNAAAAWVVDVNNAIAQLTASVTAASRTLRGKVSAIAVPKGAPDKEFALLEANINDAIAKRTAGLKITITLMATVDAKAKSLIIDGMGISIPKLKS